MGGWVGGWIDFIFLGQADPAGPLAKLDRAVHSQKCIRAGVSAHVFSSVF